MRRIFAVLLFIAAALSVASADSTVTLQLQRFDGPSAGGPNIGGGVYAYPYYFSVNGSQYPNLLALMCDSYDNEVWQGESWQAQVVPITTLFGGVNGANYKEAAWLFANMGVDPTPANAVAYNYAVWGLFSPNALNSAAYASSGATGALLAAGPVPDSFSFTGYNVYIPIAGTQTLNGSPVSNLPQEYIGFTAPPRGSEENPGGGSTQIPEPASFALCGIGLFTIGTLLKRRIH